MSLSQAVKYKVMEKRILYQSSQRSVLRRGHNTPKASKPEKLGGRVRWLPAHSRPLANEDIGRRQPSISYNLGELSPETNQTGTLVLDI